MNKFKLSIKLNIFKNKTIKNKIKFILNKKLIFKNINELYNDIGLYGIL